MAAFDRILSGIPEMDKALDNIRLGDNVVWRVSDLGEFRLFMEPYVRQAVKDNLFPLCRSRAADNGHTRG